MRASQVLRTAGRASIIIAVVAGLALAGCARKQGLAREEIPAIKQTVVALEKVIKLRDPSYLDSLLSREAGRAGTSAQSLFSFVYGDSLKEFVGFTHKQIVYRDEAARVDCNILGSDGYSRPVTITLRKEKGAWLFKKIEPGSGAPFKDEGDSVE